MLDVFWLIPAFPLVGFLLILLFGRRLGDPPSGYLAAAMVLGSFVVAVGSYVDLLSMPEEDRAHVETLFSWVPVDSLQIDMAFLADPLSVTMALFVTGIAFLIHLFAIGYMHGDPKFSKFFLYMNLFVLAMTLMCSARTCWSRSSGGKVSAPARTCSSRSGTGASRRRRPARRRSSPTGSVTGASCSRCSSGSRRSARSATST